MDTTFHKNIVTKCHIFCVSSSIIIITRDSFIYVYSNIDKNIYFWNVRTTHTMFFFLSECEWTLTTYFEDKIEQQKIYVSNTSFQRQWLKFHCGPSFSFLYILFIIFSDENDCRWCKRKKNVSWAWTASNKTSAFVWWTFKTPIMPTERKQI